MFATMAQFEREVMLERQRIGIARAKAEGKFKGRKPTARAKAAEVLALKAKNVGASEIAQTVGISRKSVYRILAACRPGPPDQPRPNRRNASRQ
jgi:DNA invertase Pin-like site-specific DNA recombinase